MSRRGSSCRERMRGNRSVPPAMTCDPSVSRSERSSPQSQGAWKAKWCICPTRGGLCQSGLPRSKLTWRGFLPELPAGETGRTMDLSGREAPVPS